MNSRRIAIIDASGVVCATMDVSDLTNASVQTPLHLEVQTQCEMGHWHSGQGVILSPWGRAIIPTDYQNYVIERRQTNDT